MAKLISPESEFENEELALSNPHILDKETFIGPYLNELEARTKDMQEMHEIFFSAYSYLNPYIWQ